MVEKDVPECQGSRRVGDCDLRVFKLKGPERGKARFGEQNHGRAIFLHARAGGTLGGRERGRAEKEQVRGEIQDKQKRARTWKKSKLTQGARPTSGKKASTLDRGKTQTSKSNRRGFGDYRTGKAKLTAPC